MNGYLHIAETVSVLQTGEWRQKTEITKTVCLCTGRICKLSLFLDQVCLCFWASIKYYFGF